MIKGYRGVRMDDKSYATIAKKVMRRFDISEKHAPGMETVLTDRIKAYTEAVTQGRSGYQYRVPRKAGRQAN